MSLESAFLSPRKTKNLKVTNVINSDRIPSNHQRRWKPTLRYCLFQSFIFITNSTIGLFPFACSSMNEIIIDDRHDFLLENLSCFKIDLSKSCLFSLFSSSTIWKMLLHLSVIAVSRKRVFRILDSKLTFLFLR